MACIIVGETLSLITQLFVSQGSWLQSLWVLEGWKPASMKCFSCWKLYVHMNWISFFTVTWLNYTFEHLKDVWWINHLLLQISVCEHLVDLCSDPTCDHRSELTLIISRIILCQSVVCPPGVSVCNGFLSCTCRTQQAGGARWMRKQVLTYSFLFVG